MQHVNDDMDDIFRRAGKDYPLDTSGADWDKIAAGLKYPVEGKTNDNRKYLWLLLLLPLPWICMKFSGSGEKPPIAETKQQSAPKAISNSNNGITTTVNPADQNLNNKAASEKATVENAPDIETPVNKVASNSTTHLSSSSAASSKKRETGNYNSGITSSQQKNNSAFINTNRTKNKSTVFQSAPIRNNTGNLLAIVTKNKSRDQLVTGKKDHKDNLVNQPKDNPDQNVIAMNNNNDVKQKENDQVATEDKKSINPISTQPSLQTINSADSTKIETNPVVVATINNKKPETRNQKQETRNQKLYAGIFAGVGVTSIKGQKASNPGLDLGIFAGFNFNRHFAVEAAAVSSKKYYYSNGDYYDKSKIYMPPNSKLTVVNGDCRMIEIPVSMRYNFNAGKTAGWFLTAGVSNFLMKQENYDYTYYYYTGNYSSTYHKTYLKSSQDWLAVFQLSAGKTFNLGFVQLRLEPYAQLPLKGAGYGKLPLTSYGFRLGLQRGIIGKH
jgi:hypothetical protein